MARKRLSQQNRPKKRPRILKKLAILLAIAVSLYIAFLRPSTAQEASLPYETISAYPPTEKPSKQPPLEAILERIAFCESGDRQFDAAGNVVRGRVNQLDTGRFQINLKFHQARAESMGLDLFTWDGNTAYAQYLYKTQGTTPWLPSKGCWGPYLEK